MEERGGGWREREGGVEGERERVGERERGGWRKREGGVEGERDALEWRNITLTLHANKYKDLATI